MRRRQFLRGSAWTLAGACAGVLDPQVARAAARLRPRREPDVTVQLRAKRGTEAILPGRRTDVWSYVAKVKAGDAGAVDVIAGSYLGPIIRLRQGQRVRIDFKNRLRQESIVHWHGLHVPESADGHPRFAVGPGGSYRYEFDVLNRAGTYWYHPHPHGRTGEQVYRGLAGLIIVTDDEEQSLGLPSGDRDVPLVIQDRHFDDDNQLRYGFFGVGGGPGMIGFLGNQILVNGLPHPTLEMAAEPYRLRLLNGSNNRIYKLAWNDRTRLTVIGTDGGLLREPVLRDFVTLAPGERVELWVDFSAWPVGSAPELRTLAFDAGMGGFGNAGGFEMPMGAPADILTVRVTTASRSRSELPAVLSSFPHYRLQDAVNPGAPRPFEFAGRSGTWTINGRTFEMTTVANDERVSLGSMEAWDLINAGGFGHGGGGMMMMRMPHPVHVHGQSFQVLQRDVDGGFGGAWGSVAGGYVDEGWKDTVLLMPGERVRILRRFDDYSGMYLIHCHNLEHEDMGMMRNFLIEE